MSAPFSRKVSMKKKEEKRVESREGSPLFMEKLEGAW